MFLEWRGTDSRTYARFVSLTLVDGQVHGKCNLCAARGCVSTSRLSRLTKGGDTYYFDYNNFKTAHLYPNHRDVLAEDDQSACSKQAEKELKSVGPGAKKRKAEAPPPAVSERSTREHRTIWVVASCLGTWALSAGSLNMGFRYLFGEYGIPITHDTTARRHFDNLYGELVVAPRKASFAALRVPTTYTSRNGSVTYTMTPKVGIQGDGWEGKGKEHFVSMVASGCKVTEPAYGTKSLLLPITVPLALRYFQHGSYAAANSSSMIVDVLEELGETVRCAWELTSDTTNGQPAIVKEPGWTWMHAEEDALLEVYTYWHPCLQHVSNLCAEDMMENVHFAAALDAAQEMSTWLFASGKRLLQLKNSHVAMGIVPALKPMRNAPTRFLQNLLVNKRILKLVPVLDYLELHSGVGGKDGIVFLGTTAAADRKEFRTRLREVKKHLALMAGIEELFDPLLVVSPRWGCSGVYTISLRSYSFRLFLQGLDAIEARIRAEIAVLAAGAAADGDESMSADD